MSKQAWEAFGSFREGQLPQASNKYQQIFEQEPTNVSAVNMLAEIATRQGQLVEALRYYRQAIRLPSESEVKSEILRKKMSRLDPDSVDDAEAEAESAAPISESVQASLEQLKATIAAEPKNLENYQKLGDFLERNGRRKEAAEQWLMVGNALFNNKAFKKAGEIFKRVVNLDNTCLPAHLALGEIYTKEGSDSDAKKEFLYVAEQLIRQGNLERGQVFAQKAIQLKSIEAHYYLGLIYLLTHQEEDAHKEFETLLKFKVNHQSGLTQLASLLSERKQWDEAVKLYERLLKIDSRNAYASERIAAAALQMNQPNLAEEKFVQAMESYAANEEWELAAYCALEAVRLDQRNQELYYKLADAAYNAGLEPQAAEACLALADLLEAEGKADEAQNLRTKARELQSGGKVEPVLPPPTAAAAKPQAAAKPHAAPEDVSVMLNVADTYVQQGALDEAIEVYQKILKREPNNQKVRTALTRVYAMFAGLNPETAVARKNQAPAASPGREPDEQRVQREARERAIREAQVRAQRTTSQDAAGAASAKPAAKEDEWLQTVGNARGDEIAGDHQDEFMTVTVAEIYTKQGLLSEALKIYQKILEIEPGNMEAQVKKQQLEKRVAEQEKIRQQTQDAQAAQAAAKEPDQKEAPTAEAPPSAQPKPAPAKDQNGGDEPPAGRGKRGRVSYV